jgi:hypothetical protein
MATPNILHDYGSYTYHFILYATKNTAVIDALDSKADNSLDKWSHPQERYAAKSGSGGDYVILHNSMTDSDFSIDQFNCKHIINTGFIQTVEASMVVVEPLTVDFIGALSQAAKSLGSTNAINSSTISTNIVGLKFGLKIVFVGYKTVNNQTHIPEIITSIDTIRFIMGVIDMDFTAKGAEYKIKCVPLANASFNSYVSYAGNRTMSLRLPLVDALKDVEKYINDESQEQGKKNNKPVYDVKIRLDPYYQDKKFIIDNVTQDNLNKVTAKPQSQTPGAPATSNKVPNNTDAISNSETVLHYNAGNNDKVQDILENILLKCSEVAKDITEKNIHPKVIGNLSTENNKDVYIFMITPFKNAKDEDSKSNILEYDYYYTGKNVDIIGFKINIPVNLTVAGSNTTYHIHPNTVNDNKKLNDVNNALNNPSNTSASKTPANVNQPTNMSGVKIDEDNMSPLAMISNYLPDANASDPSGIYNARAGLNKAVNIQSFKSQLDIIGNPEILQKQLYNTEKYTPQLLIAKVNVRAPKPNYMQGAGEYYSTPFLNLKNGYIVQDVTSNFVSGKFTQSLNLTSYPETTLSNKVINSKSNTQQANDAKNNTPQSNDAKSLKDTVKECTASDAQTTTVPNENITSSTTASADNVANNTLYGAFAAPISGAGMVAEEFVAKNTNNPQTLNEMTAAQKANPMSQAIEPEYNTGQGTQTELSSNTVTSDVIQPPK